MCWYPCAIRRSCKKNTIGFYIVFQTLIIRRLDLTGFGDIFGDHMKIQKCSRRVCTELGSEVSMGRT